MTHVAPDAPLILLVEDNEAVRGAFTIILEDSGYRVLTAGSGSEALQRARLDPPDLVLMDLGLPDLPGLEVTRRLKADPRTRGAIVIALTGRVESDEWVNAGCAGFLSKPVNSRDLLLAIDGYLKATRE